jgi:hypothetical protein
LLAATSAWLDVTTARAKAESRMSGRYRATVGTLFEHQEICRTGDLEALVRQANAMAGCRSWCEQGTPLSGVLPATPMVG